MDTRRLDYSSYRVWGQGKPFLGFRFRVVCGAYRGYDSSNGRSRGLTEVNGISFFGGGTSTENLGSKICQHKGEDDRGAAPCDVS